MNKTSSRSLKIFLRELKDNEIDQLIAETHYFPDLGMLGREHWRRFSQMYVAYNAGRFVGVCVVVDLGQWKKIGPVVVTKKAQGKGYGKWLLTKTFDLFHDQNLFIGSSNPKICSIVQGLGFIEVPSFFGLPNSVKRYLAGYLFKRLSLTFIIDAYRKKIFLKRGSYHYFMRYGFIGEKEFPLPE